MRRLWRQGSPEARRLAEQLDELGLFGHLDSEAAARAKGAFERHGIDALWKHDLGRHAYAGDAEDLAEGGVGRFLEELRPHLEARGVRFLEVADEFDQSHSRYVVRVDDERFTIYDPPSADADDMGRMWGLAWVRAFEIVNDQLARAGARERAYAMPEWDVWFLTPQQLDLLRAAIPTARDRPYLPIDEPPGMAQITDPRSGTLMLVATLSR